MPSAIIQLRGTCRKEHQLERELAEDPAGIPELGEAMEGLLIAQPPKPAQQLMAERPDAMDAAERAELKKVDTWLREQLTDGPVPYDTLRDRARAAGITVRGWREGFGFSYWSAVR